jgi:multidrug efflux pump subunit AcrB
VERDLDGFGLVALLFQAIEAEGDEKLTPLEAIHKAILRFRPIMMTTMAALLGAVPFAFWPPPASVSSSFRSPLNRHWAGFRLSPQ